MHKNNTCFLTLILLSHLGLVVRLHSFNYTDKWVKKFYKMRTKNCDKVNIL